MVLAFDHCGLGGCFGAEIPPIPYGKAPCPPRYYQDPETGACIFMGRSIATQIPTWAWGLIGAGGALILAWFIAERR